MVFISIIQCSKYVTEYLYMFRGTSFCSRIREDKDGLLQYVTEKAYGVSYTLPIYKFYTLVYIKKTYKGIVS